MPWIKHGYLLENRPNFALDPLFHAGAYYVQDSSSMILWQFLSDLNRENQLVLDTCAAPGGKSTLLLDWLDNKGFLIANEIDKKRTRILNENILKWGKTNVATTSLSTSYFETSSCEFDLVVVDAPCSGEGMFRKDEHARIQWNEDLVDHCSIIQENILDDVSEIIGNGGHLIYSTCTTNPRENETQIQRLLSTNVFELDLTTIDSFSNHIIPLHGSAMIPTEIHQIEVDKDNALKFLRKETISLRAETGWHLIRYQGVALGWVKVLPNRVNNYYPQWLRLRI